MGMFDYIKDELYCPFCGVKSDKCDYQTKDIGNMLDEWSIKEIIQFSKNDEISIYHACKNCNRWINIIINVRREKEKKKKRKNAR